MKRFHKQIKTGAAFLLCGAAVALTTSLAADASELRKDLVVTDAVVKLSDIFTDTGATGETVIMEAPAPGARKQLSSYELSRLAIKYELDWERPDYLKRVYVHREGQAFKLNELADTMMEHIKAEGLDAEYKVSIFGRKNGLYLPSGYTIDDITVEQFSLNQPKDRFRALLLLPTGTNEPAELRITGSVEEVRLIPVLNRLLTPGEVIDRSDISWIKYPAKRILRNSIVSLRELEGLTVKRPLQPERMIRKNDVAAPVSVERGSMVFVTYQSGALTLTMQARALEDGGIGDTIRLMNTKSKKTVFGVVASPEKVLIAANKKLNLASR